MLIPLLDQEGLRGWLIWQGSHGRLPIPETVVDGLNDNPDSLLLAEVQIDRRLQNALSEDGFGYLRHGHLP